MPRPLKVERPMPFKVYLPESLYARIRLHLYNEALNDLPVGAISEWFEALARQELERIESGNKKVEATKGEST